MRASDPTDGPTDGPRVLDVTRRFADMDPLGHVNNVRYLDYLAAGREDLLVGHGIEPADVAVRRHRVGFLSPMVFGRAPAQVRTWVVDSGGDRVVLAQEVSSRGHRGDEDPSVHLRTESVVVGGDPRTLRDALVGATYGEAPVWRDVTAPDRTPRHTWDARLRTRDLDARGVARDDAVMEAFQESRVRYLMELHSGGEDWGQVVVAHTDLDFVAPAPGGTDLQVRSWVAHVGGSSCTLRGDLVDEAGTTLSRATVVLVCFDPVSQRPAPMGDVMRARLQAEAAGH